jgi:hypothetical protein
MDVLLLSNRGAEAAPHWSEALAATVAGGLASAGATVRWLCSTTPYRAVPVAPAGVELLTLRGGTPPFRSVQARNEELAVDVALTRQLRRRPADVVIHFGLGSPGSANTCWFADRMGAATVAAVRVAEALCHRQTLIDASGAVCREVTDPERCTRCCSAGDAAGLGPTQSKLAGACRVFGSMSPFPHSNAFKTRFDLVFASLQVTAAIYVSREADREQLIAAGLGKQNIIVADPQRLTAADLTAICAAAAAS